VVETADTLMRTTADKIALARRVLQLLARVVDADLR
jgi:hypothetical protein